MRRLKTKTFLAGAAVAVLAFAIPASASAYTWTNNGVELKKGQTAKESYQGPFGDSFIGVGSFQCETTIQIQAQGPSGGWITSFVSDPLTCFGTGPWAECKLVEQSANTAWSINVGTSPPTIKAKVGDIEIVRKFEPGSCAGGPTERTYVFSQLELIPTLDEEGGITEFTLEGSGPSYLTLGGPFTPTGTSENHLGLK